MITAVPLPATATLRVLAVEVDSDLERQALRQRLESFGFELTGIAASAAEALAHFDADEPDVVLLDVNLRGPHDGVEVALELNRRRPVPLIFVSSATDAATFERACQAYPFAFLTKPYNPTELAHAIALAVQHFAREQHLGEAHHPTALADPALNPSATTSEGVVLVRENGRLHRVPLDTVFWIEADGSYCHLHADGRKYTIKTSLRELGHRLPAGKYVRVHRAHLVRIGQIDRVDPRDHQLWVRGQAVAIGRAYREELSRCLPPRL